MVAQIGTYIMPQKNKRYAYFHKKSRHFEITRGNAKQKVGKSSYFEEKVQ